MADLRSDWIELHRPDGEAVFVKIDHITYLMKPAKGLTDQRAKSQVQFGGLSFFVRETVEEILEELSCRMSDATS